MHSKGAVVIGCGIMGGDIAALFLAQGWGVQVVERSETRWPAATVSIGKAVRQLGAVLDSQKLRFRHELGDVVWDSVDVVLEAVTEDLVRKRAVFAELDRVVPAGVPIGSNSSSMRISEIAAECATASRMANTHFFQPAHLVPLVEIAKGERTDAATVELLHGIFATLGRAPVRVNRDVPGFLANRIQHALMREAFAAIDEGLATPEDVDIAVRYGFGFRYAAAGPILLKEFAGFDTQHAAASVIYPSLCNDTKPGRTLAGLVERGHFGVKVGKGLRDWSEEQIVRERARYESALIRAAEILQSDATTARSASQ
jgi:3-hydroxybutyryl-CoA dehydrogenase